VTAETSFSVSSGLTVPDQEDIRGKGHVAFI
jgi:hypothetical protein